jgi:transcriptional regulator with XRE-family HTH domain
MSFIENLKSELDYAEMQVKELAKETGISEGTIYNYFNGRVKMPAADAAVSIARVLGVSVEYLVTGSEMSPKSSPVHLSPETRKAARNLENFNPEYRKIAIAFIETLKKLDEMQKLPPRK